MSVKCFEILVWKKRNILLLYKTRTPGSEYSSFNCSKMKSVLLPREGNNYCAGTPGIWSVDWHQCQSSSRQTKRFLALGPGSLFFCRSPRINQQLGLTICLGPCQELEITFRADFDQAQVMHVNSFVNLALGEYSTCRWYGSGTKAFTIRKKKSLLCALLLNIAGLSYFTATDQQPELFCYEGKEQKQQRPEVVTIC